MGRPKLDMACLTQCGNEDNEPGQGKGQCHGGVTSTLLVRERWHCPRSRCGALHCCPRHGWVIRSVLGRSMTKGFPQCGRLYFSFVVVCLQARSTGNCSADKTSSTASTVVSQCGSQCPSRPVRKSTRASEPEPAWRPVPLEASA